MSEKSLSRWLKFIILLTSVCSAVVYFLFIPIIGHAILYDYPEMSSRFWPWLIFIWTTAIPFYTALVFAWQLALNIGKGKPFCIKNAKKLSAVAILSAADVTYFFAGNILLLLFNLSHPGMILAALLIVAVGVVISVAASILSHLIKTAADLQAQSDLTI